MQFKNIYLDYDMIKIIVYRYNITHFNLKIIHTLKQNYYLIILPIILPIMLQLKLFIHNT